MTAWIQVSFLPFLCPVSGKSRHLSLPLCKREHAACTAARFRDDMSSSVAQGPALPQHCSCRHHLPERPHGPREPLAQLTAAAATRDSGGPGVGDAPPRRARRPGRPPGSYRLGFSRANPGLGSGGVGARRSLNPKFHAGRDGTRERGVSPARPESLGEPTATHPCAAAASPGA